MLGEPRGYDVDDTGIDACIETGEDAEKVVLLAEHVLIRIFFYAPTRTSSMSEFPTRRMRRLRREGFRDLVEETTVTANDLVAPLFVDANLDEKREIPSMPDEYRYPVEDAAVRAGELRDLGVRAVILFGVPESKDEQGTRALGGRRRRPACGATYQRVGRRPSRNHRPLYV